MGGGTRRAVSNIGKSRPSPWLRRLRTLSDSRKALRYWQGDPPSRWQSQGGRAGRKLEFRHCSFVGAERGQSRPPTVAT